MARNKGWKEQMKVLGRSRRGSAFGAVSIGILIFTLATLLTLSACGSDEPEVVDTATPEPVVPTATSAPEPTEEPTSEPTVEPTAEPTEAPTQAPVARTEPIELLDKDVRDIDAWINSEPTSIAELTSQGKVVLVDFWTYTCVNCLRTLPFLREWQEKYSDNGLVILGVHAPEFEFEKELENVQMAVDDEGASGTEVFVATGAAVAATVGTGVAVGSSLEHATANNANSPMAAAKVVT